MIHYSVRDSRADTASLLHIAALLPFAKNRFVTRAAFEEPLMPKFPQDSFNPTQVRAIQHLIVHCGTLSPASLVPGAALAKLSGLKTFEVVVDLTLSYESLASLKTLSSTSATKAPEDRNSPRFTSVWTYTKVGTSASVGIMGNCHH
jgi:hypothetical protein